MSIYVSLIRLACHISLKDHHWSLLSLEWQLNPCCYLYGAWGSPHSPSSFPAWNPNCPWAICSHCVVPSFFSPEYVTWKAWPVCPFCSWSTQAQNALSAHMDPSELIKTSSSFHKTLSNPLNVLIIFCFPSVPVILGPCASFLLSFYITCVLRVDFLTPWGQAPCYSFLCAPQLLTKGTVDPQYIIVEKAEMLIQYWSRN